MVFHVASEVGRLRQVIVHRPGMEMSRLTPENKDRYLFDDVLWLPRAQEEHDMFVQIMRDRGITVHHFDRLLKETVDVPEAREWVVNRSLDERVYGPMATYALQDMFRDLDSEELTRYLIGGVTKREVLDHISEPQSIVIGAMDMDDMVLAPLPNHLFTRDTSAWVYDGVSINSMQKPARRRETVHYEAIYRWHPMFAGDQFRAWSHGLAAGPATTEGGDILVLGKGVVLVGMSERTVPEGVERLAEALLRAGSARAVIALDMPKSRATMHLDTVMTMVTEDTFTKWAGLGMLRSWTMTGNDDGGLQVAYNEPERMHDAIAEALGLDSIRVLTPDYDSFTAAREQWDDGVNFLALEPGVVVGYERNTAGNEYFRNQGLEVLVFPGNELGRGRGGARCMSCPIERDGI